MPGPFKPDLAPAGDPPHNPSREEAPKDKIKDLLAKADREEKALARQAKKDVKIVVGGISTEVISELAEHLGHLTGVGTVLTSGKHFVAAESTQQHLDELSEMRNPAYLLEKCKCGQCEVLVNYAYDQKESKLYRRLAKAMPIPFGSSVIRLGKRPAARTRSSGPRIAAFSAGRMPASSGSVPSTAARLPRHSWRNCSAAFPK
jgi:hypothetical protein